MNKVRPLTNIILSFLAIIVSVFTILPLIFVVIISFSSEESIVSKGYSFIPNDWSLAAYRYMLGSLDYIGRSFLLSVAITVLGTMLSLWLIGTMAFVISQNSFCFKKYF